MVAIGLEAWTYDIDGFLVSIGFLALSNNLLLWKYFDMMLTSLLDFAGRRGGGETFSIMTGMGLGVSLLILLVEGEILGVNLDNIFALSVVVLLSV